MTSTNKNLLMSLLFIPAINSQPFKLKWWRVLHRFVYSAIYHGGWLIIQLKNIKVYGCLWKSMDKAKKIESVNVWWETKITWGKCNLSYIRLLSRARLVIESPPALMILVCVPLDRQAFWTQNDFGLDDDNL